MDEVYMIEEKCTADTIKSMGELVPQAMMAMQLKFIADLGAVGFNEAQIEMLTSGIEERDGAGMTADEKEDKDYEVTKFPKA